MKTLRRLIPSLVLGLTVAVAGVSFAQSANQASGDDKHSCCGMTSGCCGDSCQMKKKDGAKNHAKSADKEGCCRGDSCQMKKKDGMKNHAASADKEGCCGDSCQMKKKDGAKSHATSADKAGGCCGDSCHMKEGAKTTMTTTPASDTHECCCCGDSCNMKHGKTEKP
jgi:hypothetical protein